MKLNEPEPKIDISEMIRITGAVNVRNEKICRLVKLQKLEAMIKILRGDGEVDLAEEYEKVLRANLPAGFDDLAEVAATMARSLEERRWEAGALGFQGHGFDQFMARAKIMVVDLVEFANPERGFDRVG